MSLSNELIKIKKLKIRAKVFPNHNFTGSLINLDTIIMVKYTVDIKNNKMDMSREVAGIALLHFFALFLGLLAALTVQYCIVPHCTLLYCAV